MASRLSWLANYSRTLKVANCFSSQFARGPHEDSLFRQQQPEVCTRRRKYVKQSEKLKRAKLRRDLGINVALTTINDSVVRVGEFRISMVDWMMRDLLAGNYIQADETRDDAFQLWVGRLGFRVHLEGVDKLAPGMC